MTEEQREDHGEDITIQTITLLPVEIGEEKYKHLDKYIEKNKNDIQDTRDCEIERKITNDKIHRIAVLKEPKIVDSGEKEDPFYYHHAEETEIYSAVARIDGEKIKTSICIVRETKFTNIVKDEETSEVAKAVADKIRSNNEFITQINLEEEAGNLMKTALDDTSNSFRGILSDLGYHEKKWSQYTPRFHYTFNIIRCKKEYATKAKFLAYYLDSSNLTILFPSDLKLPDEDDTTIPKAFGTKIVPRLELYLLANRSTFTILAVDYNDGEPIDLSNFPTQAAIRVQSVRNLCHYYSTIALGSISSNDGQRILNFAENILAEPIYSTEETLATKIMENLITPSGIQEQLRTLNGLIASKKASEEAARERRTNIILTMIAIAFALYTTYEVSNTVTVIILLALLLVMAPTIRRIIYLSWKKKWRKRFISIYRYIRNTFRKKRSNS